MAGPIETDVAVLGVGTCGEDVSLQLLDAGLDVVGVEADLVGGECPYWACLPTKRMIRMATLVQEARRADGLVGSTSVSTDWAVVAEQVSREVTGGWDDSGAVARFERRGGRLLRGRGHFTAADTVRVGEETVVARRGVVIATGSSPVVPPIDGLGDAGAWTTRDVIAATELPASIAVLGGGAVGCELAQLMARFGVEVIVVEAADRLLPGEEPEVSRLVEEVFAAEGIDMALGRRLERVQSRDSSMSLVLDGGEEITAERLLVAVGRTANLSGLGLDRAGIETGPRGLQVDDHMRVASGVWAVGDVTGAPMLTSVALAQAMRAVADILDRPSQPIRRDAIPRVTFTDPEVGSVGLTEAQARDNGMAVDAVVKRVPATFRGWLHRIGNEGIVKLVVDRDSDRVVGASVAAPSGGEVLGLLALAVHARVPVGELETMVYAFPTFHGAIGEAMGAYGAGVTTVLDPSFGGFESTRVD